MADSSAGRDRGSVVPVLAGHPIREVSLTLAGRTIRLLRPVADPADLLDDPDVQRRFDADEYMPYWADLWPAAVCLAHHLLAEEPVAPGTTALELGCGLGLVSVAAALAGYRVIATDYDPAAVTFAVANGCLNGVELRAEPLDWRDASFAETLDLILAADVLYERRNHEPVAGLLARCLAPRGRALLADPHRAAAAGATDLFTAAGLECRCREIAVAAPDPVSDPVPGHPFGAPSDGSAFRAVLYELARSPMPPKWHW